MTGPGDDLVGWWGRRRRRRSVGPPAQCVLPHRAPLGVPARFGLHQRGSADAVVGLLGDHQGGPPPREVAVASWRRAPQRAPRDPGEVGLVPQEVASVLHTLWHVGAQSLRQKGGHDGADCSDQAQNHVRQKRQRVGLEDKGEQGQLVSPKVNSTFELEVMLTTILNLSYWGHLCSLSVLLNTTLPIRFII